MRTVTLQATKKHPTRTEGEAYEATGGQALVDLATRRAIAYRAPKIEQETIHLPPEKKPKRKYKRRDLRAEE